MRQTVSGLVIGVSAFCCCITLSASEPATSAAFEEIGKTVWFDPATQSVVPVPLEDADPDTIHRNSRWLPEAKKIKKASPTSVSPSTTGWFNTGLTTGNLVGWAILVILFIAVAAAVLYGFSKIDPNTMSALEQARRNRDGLPDEQTLRRIDELPAELRRTDVDLRTEAERLMNLGALDEAIKCLFGHQLLVLDRRRFLRLSRGKTNGRYVMETKRRSSEAAALLRSSADAFEASYFGRHTPTRQAFERLWQDNERLEVLSSAESEVAA
ncbi:MAG: DUF4129 domain-containing protein [Planctomycetaceae bacterium]